MFQAAIKGKLQELGAYVGKLLIYTLYPLGVRFKPCVRDRVCSLIPDEELPDYIMVMVANKKNAQQMADDLSLFLGNNTIKFTVW